MSNYQQEAALAIRNAEFRTAWPIDVRKALVRAAQTEGEFPPFAARETLWALKAARAVEQRCARDIAVGEAGLSQAQRKALVKAR